MESFEADLEVEGLRESNRAFHGVFIRAPVRSPPSKLYHIPLTETSPQVVLNLTPSLTDPPIQVISRISASLLPASVGPIDEDDTDPTDPRTIVALRQGKHLLTTFHPELTKDCRFHEFFITDCVLPTLND